MKKRRLDDKGLSLLEYVVVFAIIAVVGAVMIFSLKAVLNKPAEQCAAQLKTTIEKHRVETMGKNVSDMRLYVNGEGAFAELSYDGNSKVVQVGTKGVTIKYLVSGSGLSEVNSTGINIKFDRSNGALEKNGTGYIREYQISKGDKTVTLKIEPLTGKVNIE